MLVATADPLDQFLAHHPEYLFERSPEQALINPDNLLILLEHLRCAAFELPFQAGEGFGRLQRGRADGVPGSSGGRRCAARLRGPLFLDGRPVPGATTSRCAAPRPSPCCCRLRTGAGYRTIGQVDLASAPWMVHPQAIYLHEGQTYLVEELDLEQRSPTCAGSKWIITPSRAARRP